MQIPNFKTSAKSAQNFGLKSKLFFYLNKIVQKIKLVRNCQYSQKLSKWLKNVEMVKNIKKEKNQND